MNISRKFLLILALVFIGVFGALVAIRAQLFGATPDLDAVTAAGDLDCAECGAADNGAFGWGRPVGSQLLPAEQIDGPTALVLYRADCPYCLVPIATLVHASAQTSAENCHAKPLNVWLIAGNEQDRAEARTLGQRVTEKLGQEQIRMEVTVADSTWRSLFATDVSPSTIVLNDRSMIVGSWIGFDPGHVPDLVNAVSKASNCKSSVAPEITVQSAISVANIGDKIPDWILQEARIETGLPAVLLFSDDHCPLCMEIKEELTAQLVPKLQQQMSVLFVDSTPSLKFLQDRADHLHLLEENDVVGTTLLESVSLPVPHELDLRAEEDTEWVYKDDQRVLISSLVRGTVPSAIVIDSSGRLAARVVFQAGETPNSFLMRVESEVVAAATRELANTSNVFSR